MSKELKMSKESQHSIKFLLKGINFEISWRLALEAITQVQLISLRQLLPGCEHRQTSTYQPTILARMLKFKHPQIYQAKIAPSSKEAII